MFSAIVCQVFCTVCVNVPKMFPKMFLAPGKWIAISEVIIVQAGF